MIGRILVVALALLIGARSAGAQQSYTACETFIKPTPLAFGTTNTWGYSLNTNFDLIDTAIAGSSSVSVAGSANVILSSFQGAPDQSRYAGYSFTGALSGNITVFWPKSLCRNFWVTNSTTGAFTLSLAVNNGSGVAAGAVVVVGRGQTIAAYSDGTSVIARGFLSSGGASVGGPSSSVSGNLACWNNTLGTLLKDCGSQILLSGPNVWSGLNTYTAGLASNPPTGTITNGISITQTGPTAGSVGLLYNPFNELQVNADALSSGTNIVDAFGIDYTFGGSNMTGPRTGMQINITPTGSNSADTSPFYNAIIANIEAYGTVANSGNKAGNATAYDAFVQLHSTAQNYNSAGGYEADIGVDTGSTVAARNGFAAISYGNVAGATTDAAYVLASQAGVSWRTALWLADFSGGHALSTTGCVICVDGSTDTIGTGIDLHTYTISGNFLDGPGEFFRVTGAGALRALTANVTGNVLSTTANGVNSSYSLWNTGGTELWSVGKDGSNDFYIFDSVNNANVLAVTPAGVTQVGEGGQLIIPKSGPIQISTGTPSSSAAACSTGQIEFDSAFVYTCVSANTWRRAATSSF